MTYTYYRLDGVIYREPVPGPGEDRHDVFYRIDLWTGAEWRRITDADTGMQPLTYGTPITAAEAAKWTTSDQTPDQG